MRDQRAGNLQPLQHAAGEGARQVVHSVGVDLHLAQPVDGRRADIAVVAHARRHEPLAHVAAGSDAHAQRCAGVLPHEPPIGAVQRAQGGGGHGVEVVQLARRVGVGDDAVVWADCAGQHVQQRGLARARLAHDRQHLTRP